jgi:glycosyltransferase involved in cell wall biosynthesis
VRKIKILRIIARLNIGGPAIQAIELTARLDRDIFESLLVSGVEAPHEGNMRDLASRRGVHPIVLPGLGREIRPLKDIETLMQLYRLIRRERPHIVHTHTAKAGTLGRLAARLAHVPVIVHTFHGHIFRGYFRPAKNRAFIIIERVLGRFTDRLVTVSPRLKEDIVSFGIAKPDKIVVIPLGFDLNPFRSAYGDAFREELGIPAGAKLVGIVGRLTAVKNHSLFIRVAGHIAAARPDVFFVIVGDGELRADLERLAEEAGLSQRTFFTGWRNDMPAVYASLDVVALSSLSEGTPVTLIEAMASGKPVIATSVGGIPDLVSSGENGFLVDPDDELAFARRIITLLDDTGMAQKMGEEGRRRALQSYSMERLIGDVSGLYMSLLKRKNLS